MTVTYRVPDMSCSHCVSTITQAVKAVDAQATVDIDLAQHLVRIEPRVADAAALQRAIEDAGYTPAAAS